ncbi:MAG: serpin family protein, partial [Methanomicrobiales archaeon]|nr:serpin family protein [Methanomicrobiales archaeon]
MKKLLIFSGISILVLALIVAGLIAVGTAPQNTTRPDTPDGAGNVAAGNNQFAFDLYR